MLHIAPHPDTCRELAEHRHEQLRRTAHVARLVREARAAERAQRRHRRRH